MSTCHPVPMSSGLPMARKEYWYRTDEQKFAVEAAKQAARRLSELATEPRRVCRRLPFLRRWSNEQIQDKTELFAGGA
jgi:hypothetical protein